MGKQVWVGEHLWNLLNHSVKELQSMYPAYNRNTLKGKKSYWTNKLREGKIAMPPSPESGEREPVPNEDILAQHGLTAPDGATISYHIGYIKNSEGEIEYTKPLPSVHPRQLGTRSLSDFISQADPVRITPSRRKPAQRDHDVMVVFSDTQISYMDIHGDGELTPTHDERYINIVRQVCQDYQPEFIVDTSDTVDFSNLSRFPADSPRFNVSLNHSINRAHRMYAELRADNPASKIVSIDSNHTERLAKFLMKQAPELYGLRQAGSDSQYGALTYPFLMNFEAIGVDWYGGYRGARYIHGEEYGIPIVFKHGESAVSNGSTAAKESKENPETHVVRGHSHRAELFHRTNRSGQYLTSMVIGCGCDVHGTVPSYHSSVDSNGVPNDYQENWQQSIGLIFDYKDGNYDFNHIMVRDGVGRYNGKEYVADDNEK